MKKIISQFHSFLEEESETQTLYHELSIDLRDFSYSIKLRTAIKISIKLGFKMQKNN